VIKRIASAVIGSAFGDEGKGLMTDFLAAQAGDRAVVVRFNGGAQAGHTVQTSQGTRHVFHQFGAGAFAGASTHLSRFFVANPILFRQERAALRALGANTDISISAEALVSTPWDMFANTEIETFRGAGRRGSCGLGIGETVSRQERTPWGLKVKDLRSPTLSRQLRDIRDQWLPQRMAAVGHQPKGETHAAIQSEELFERFLEDLTNFTEQVVVAEIAQATAAQDVIFEGAQGLLLDQKAGAPWYPHVTRSNTGLSNVLELACEGGLHAVEVYYMARPYLTRHGAGPLPFEYREKPHAGIVDETNIPNAWQGSLRYAPLNLDLLESSIKCDLRAGDANAGIAVSPRLGMSCADQVEGLLDVVVGDQVVKMSLDEVLQRASLSACAAETWISSGPSRETLKRCA